MEVVKDRDPRGEMPDDEATVALIDNPDSTEEIPTLDFAPYLEGRPGGLEEVAAKLREITMTVGFFYLRNHGIPQETIDRVFAESRRFHALPEEEKLKLSTRDETGFMLGYISKAREKSISKNTALITGTKPDHLTQFTVHPEVEGAPALNPWPENLPGFREGVTEYHRAIGKLARQFLPLWSYSLDLRADYFDKAFEKPHLQLSLLHYPPQRAVGERQYGIAPHTDNSTMTFLAQDDVAGLAVRMPSGHWKAVEPRPGTLLVNTGNSLVRWTNDKYLSTKHRVINTNTKDRYAIPVFFGPSDDTVLDVLPTCRNPNEPALYEPVTYGELRRWYFGKQDDQADKK